MDQKVSGAKGQQREPQFHSFEKRRKKKKFSILGLSFHVDLEWAGNRNIFRFALTWGTELMQESLVGGGVLKGWEWVRPISVCYVLLAAVLGRLFICRGTNHPEGLDALLEPSLENLQPRHTRIINQVWFIMMAFFFLLCFVLLLFLTKRTN